MSNPQRVERIRKALAGEDHPDHCHHCDCSHDEPMEGADSLLDEAIAVALEGLMQVVEDDPASKVGLQAATAITDFYVRSNRTW